MEKIEPNFEYISFAEEVLNKENQSKKIIGFKTCFVVDKDGMKMSNYSPVITEIDYEQEGNIQTYMIKNIDIDSENFKQHYLVAQEDLLYWIEQGL